MTTGTQMPGKPGDVGPVLAEKNAAGVTLRPVVVLPDASEALSGPPSHLSGRGSAGVSAADFSFVERSYAEPMAAGQEQLLLNDGLGAMRGFVLVLGLYLVMGAMGLGGLMLWHWLR